MKAFHGDLLSFFDKIPIARVLNKFSNDFTVIEDKFVYAISGVLISTSMMAASVFIVCLNISVFLGVLFVFYIYLLFKIQGVYIVIKKDLHRCLNITKTPIVNLVGELIEGR